MNKDLYYDFKGIRLIEVILTFKEIFPEFKLSYDFEKEIKQYYIDLSNHLKYNPQVRKFLRDCIKKLEEIGQQNKKLGDIDTSDWIRVELLKQYKKNLAEQEKEIHRRSNKYRSKKYIFSRNIESEDLYSSILKKNKNKDGVQFLIAFIDLGFMNHVHLPKNKIQLKSHLQKSIEAQRKRLQRAKRKT